jgi:hypothetical protein
MFAGVFRMKKSRSIVVTGAPCSGGGVTDQNRFEIVYSQGSGHSDENRF